MSSSVKVERFITREELPGFFRGLADALETGGEGEFVCVEDFSGIKISIKEEFGQVSLKMKTKPRKCETRLDADPDDPASGKPSYKSLKKRMKASFKLIYKMLQEDQAPPAPAVEAFLAESRLMVTYPGMGDEYYDEYVATCGEFEAAFAAGDMAAMKAGAVELASQKGRCHAKYD